MRRLAFLLGLAALQCNAPPRAPGAATPASGGIEAARRVVDLSPATPGLAPGPAEAARPVSRVPAGSTVFLRNTDPSRFCVVRLEGDLLSSLECATVTGFAFERDRAISHPIAPGGFASLCFHDAGRYPLEVTGGAGPLHGIIEVFAP